VNGLQIIHQHLSAPLAKHFFGPVDFDDGENGGPESPPPEAFLQMLFLASPETAGAAQAELPLTLALALVEQLGKFFCVGLCDFLAHLFSFPSFFFFVNSTLLGFRR
jgi:hypothetical protein